MYKILPISLSYDLASVFTDPINLVILACFLIPSLLLIYYFVVFSRNTFVFIINTMRRFFFLVYFFLLYNYNETIGIMNGTVRLC